MRFVYQNVGFYIDKNISYSADKNYFKNWYIFDSFFFFFNIDLYYNIIHYSNDINLILNYNFRIYPHRLQNSNDISKFAFADYAVADMSLYRVFDNSLY